MRITARFKTGWSGRRILSELRTLGRGYRTQTFYQDLRRLREGVSTWEKIRYLRWDRPVSEWMHFEPEKPMPTKYGYKVELDIFNRELGIYDKLHLYVGSEERLSKEEAVSAAWGTLEVSPNPYEYEFGRIVEAWRSPF